MDWINDRLLSCVTWVEARFFNHRPTRRSRRGAEMVEVVMIVGVVAVTLALALPELRKAIEEAFKNIIEKIRTTFQ